MQRAGLRLDVVSYALLIHAYGKARREDEALAVFEEMLDAGVRPTRKTYNILLDASAISGLVEQAQTVFMCMRRDRFTPDICSYATLLSAYINVPDMEGAEKFFKRLKQDGIEPNIVTYGTLIKGYAKMNDLEKMMQKYEEMVTSGIKANQIIFTAMMDAYGRNKDFGSAVFWFKEMEVHGCPPDQKAKKVLYSLAKTDEDREEADQLTGNKSNYQSIRFPGGGSVDEDEDEGKDDDSEFSDEIDEHPALMAETRRISVEEEREGTPARMSDEHRSQERFTLTYKRKRRSLPCHIDANEKGSKGQVEHQQTDDRDTIQVVYEPKEKKTEKA
ncbi:hypothetical protein Cgig2_027293 [Carnegiea gigantea]|uniref:Pentatricopeptide repeat-containing protein n=1 Tax=Carnegiea gigantea TaxID=171969 RepID=A0A9Q1JKT9_9CARY|nr:hypothetical protein Cgig2_027293 [Carnegiea gigantea]